MTARILLQTLGCRVNQAETAALHNAFSAGGFDVVDAAEAADIAVVNTCTVTGRGDADTRKLVRRLRRQNPRLRIALVGCQAQLQGEQLATLPGVQWVVGNGAKMSLPDILASHSKDAAPAILGGDIPDGPFTVPETGGDVRRARANLKIQDGCNFFCAYCAVPYARGRARSRRFEDTVRGAEALIAGGHREIVLTGINVGCYEDDGRTLVDVVRTLTGLSGLERLRLSSIEPTTISDDLLTLMAAADNGLCPHLHVPLQSGSDAILRSMTRRYTAAEYRGVIERAAAAVPGLCLGTDVMVGFPGESEADFAATEALLKSLPFAYFHVFSYSDRDVARARQLPAQRIAADRIRARSHRLRQLSSRRRRAFMQAAIGSVKQVLFEQPRHDGWDGLTDTFIRVRVPADQILRHELLPVRLTGIKDDAMTGCLC